MAEKPEKQKDITIVIVNFVRDLVRDRIKHVIYAGLTVLATWGWTAWKNKKDELNIIASMPKKYDRLLEIRALDSAKAMAHFKEDSIKEAENLNTINKLQHKLDSVGRKCKYNDSIFSILENEDYNDILKIKQKLKIQ